MVYNVYRVKEERQGKEETMRPYNPDNGKVTANIPLDVKKSLMHKAVDLNMSLSKYIAHILIGYADGGEDEQRTDN